MTELDLEIPGLASSLIAEYGKQIGYTQRNPGEYDTITSMAAPVDNPQQIMAIVDPFKVGQTFGGGLIEAGDLKITAARESFDQFDEKPSSGDLTFIDDLPFNVINVLPTYSGELIAIYEFHVRAG
jgi:hypothetical protein